MRKTIELIEGQRFGSRTFIRELEARRVKNGTRRVVEARCDCGAVSSLDLQNLQSNLKSCMHCPVKGKAVRKGDVFGSRIVISDPYQRNGLKNYVVDVKCECGDISRSSTLDLLAGKRTACATCKQKERVIREGGYPELRPFKDHPYYGIWRGIKDRILNECSHAYQHYGGLGFTMEEEWIASFGAFATWVEQNLGPRPSEKHSIDRVNCKYGYHPKDLTGNIQLQWSTQAGQNQNRRPFRRNWGLWRVGPHEGALFAVCKAWGINDTTVKQYTRPSTRREAMSLVEAIKFVIKKFKGIDVDVKCLMEPAL